jgi:hypothetical protein
MIIATEFAGIPPQLFDLPFVNEDFDMGQLNVLVNDSKYKNQRRRYS